MTVVRDQNGNRVGTITQEGRNEVFRDSNGNRTGYIDERGVLRDTNGNALIRFSVG